MVFNRTDGLNVLFGCGEYVPGTKIIKRIPDGPNPPRIITIGEPTDPFPPIPRRRDDDLIPPRRPGGPGAPGLPSPGNPGQACTYTGYGCFRETTYCPPPNETVIRSITYNCYGVSVFYACSAAPPIDILTDYPYSTPELCEASDECNPDYGYGGPTTGSGGGKPPTTSGGGRTRFFSNCEIEDPEEPDTIYGIPPVALDEEETGGGGGDPPTISIDNIGLEDTRTMVQTYSEASLISIERDSYTGNPASEGAVSFTLADQSGNSLFSNSFSNNANNIYDRKYNIFDYSETNFSPVRNIKYRNIFSDVVSREVSYLLNNINIQSNWDEKYITGLTEDKLVDSLKAELLTAFDSILDINGRPIGRRTFVLNLLSHLVSGKIEQFDSEYYINLANKQKSRDVVTINTSLNQQVRENYVLSLASNNSMSLDTEAYNDTDTKIEVSRMRALLTDVESKFTVQTIDGVERDLNLVDPGLYVDYAQNLGLQENSGPTFDYVSPGEGDGYYYKIETETGNLIPLVLTTEQNNAYYLMSTTRKIGLEILGIDSGYTFEASSSFIDSEYSSGYYEDYQSSAQYYKLDLRSITSERTSSNFVIKSTARYVKLTDADEISDHSKTYGAKTTQLNVNFDDPFFQYVDRSGELTLSMNDISVRNLPTRRTPSGGAILTRSLPDVIIVYPVNLIQDNPTGGRSKIKPAVDETMVVRSLYGQMDFTDTSKPNDRALSRTLIWEAQNAYKYGLIGISDTNNVYYTFDSSKFTNFFNQSPRSEAGKVVNSILNRISRKYSFDHLYWWDIFSRLTTKEFSSLVFKFPSDLTTRLRTNYFGFDIQDYIYNSAQAPSNLTLIDPTVVDPTYLDPNLR